MDFGVPDNSIKFFKELKVKSEGYWRTVELDSDIFGFQTQKNTKWNTGLTEKQIDLFEHELKIKFPDGLKNYYRVMNGVDLPAINIYGNSGQAPTYSNNFYSYPDDLALIKKKINWIYKSNKITKEELTLKVISQIFPVSGHRFVLVDIKEELVLSMYGDDIIYWTDNISKLLVTEIFKDKQLPTAFKAQLSNAGKVNFWLDYQ